MNKILLGFVILCSAMAFGQASALSAQPQVILMPDHPQHADFAKMSCEHPLVGGGPETYTYEKGERPLWEFGSVSEPVSLGDVARAYRKTRRASRKAEITLEKQGS